MLKSVDHLYIAVSAFARLECCDDVVMRALGRHKGDTVNAGGPHAHY